MANRADFLTDNRTYFIANRAARQHAGDLSVVVDTNVASVLLASPPPTCGRSSVVEKKPVRPREGISASFLGTSVSVVVGGLSAFTIEVALALLALLGLLALSQFPRTRLSHRPRLDL